MEANGSVLSTSGLDLCLTVTDWTVAMAVNSVNDVYEKATVESKRYHAI